MTIEATSGSSTANSYGSLAESKAYFASAYNRTAWGLAADSALEACLIESTRQLDMLFDWIGYAASNTQALSWPRRDDNWDAPIHINYTVINDVKFDVNPLDGTIIPKELKYAQFEFAYEILQSGFSLDTQALNRLRLSSIDITFSKTNLAPMIPKPVIEALRKLGTFAVSSGPQAKSVSLIRT